MEIKSTESMSKPPRYSETARDQLNRVLQPSKTPEDGTVITYFRNATQQRNTAIYSRAKNAWIVIDVSGSVTVTSNEVMIPRLMDSIESVMVATTWDRL